MSEAQQPTACPICRGGTVAATTSKTLRGGGPPFPPVTIRIERNRYRCLRCGWTWRTDVQTEFPTSTEVRP